jgi:uncharacterized membrane protein
MGNPQQQLQALKAQVASLTARVYRLEQTRDLASSESQEGAVTQPVPQPVVEGTPVVTDEPGPTAPTGVAFPGPLPVLSTPARRDGELEKKIGQYWLNRIGIAAMLMGVSYFLKYAFENNWIGPAGRIVVGLVAGIALILWSERFRARNYAAFSYSLKAVGIGTLYLSLWGAFQVYHLIPAAAAFVAMAMVTAATIALALSQNAELLASFAMVGGFATPVLLSTGENHEVALFSYVALLDVAILAMAIVRPWCRLLWGSFAGTVTLFVGWYVSYYRDGYAGYYPSHQRPLTVCFAALFAAIFAAIPLATRYERSTRFAGASVTLTLIPLLNAFVFFLQLYLMYERETVTLTWFALALGAVYLGIGGSFKKRFPNEDTKFINLLHVAIAIAFITIAIPLKLDAQWITIGWLIESAVLLWVSVRTQTNFLRYLALAALTLGIIRLLFYDYFRAETLFLNARFASYAVAIAVLGGVAVLGKRHASEREMPFLQGAVVALNLLALIALTWEASDYFDRQMALPGNYKGQFHQLLVLRGFTYSAVWLIYGAMLMAVGFRTRSAFVRWQALILIAFTTAKVFLYDVSQLGGSYRILSFLALGAVLLGISFIYQRDWLKLSPRPADDSAKELS